MTFPRARLIVSAALFLAWLGYLLVLVLLSRQTIVLSRSQFLAAPLWVIAEVSENEKEKGTPSDKALIVDVALPRDRDKLKGKPLTILNLPQTGPQGFIGPGNYILPLQPLQPGGPFVVVMVPSSPGFTPKFVDVAITAGAADADLIARIAHEDLGVDEVATRNVLKEVQAPLTVTIRLKAGVPWDKAQAFRTHLKEEKAKAADVTLTPNDVRIYPLTPETREQLEEMVAAHRRVNE